MPVHAHPTATQSQATVSHVNTRAAIRLKILIASNGVIKILNHD